MSAPVQTRHFKTLTEFDYSSLSTQMLIHMQHGVEDMVAVLQEAAEAEYHVLTDVLASVEDEPFTQWQHYPPGDVHDRDNGALWFYHAHEEDKLARPWEEHGHFHLFTYTEHAPENAEPLALPPEPDYENGGLCHLVAVSFNNSGIPVQLFTVNRWVAMEWQYPADVVISMIDRFRIENPIDGKEKYDLTSRWLMALLKVYRPQIEWALRERDALIASMKADDPDNWSEDETVEVLSAVTFDFAGQIDRIEEALAAKQGA